MQGVLRGPRRAQFWPPLYSNVDGAPLAWTALLLKDLRALLSRGVNGTAGLTDPLVGADAWNAIMSNKGSWDQVVSDLFYVESNSDRHSFDVPAEIVSHFNCPECQRAFATSRALQSHERAKHGKTSVLKYYLRSAVCPACNTDFAQRIRCLKHVSDPRRPKCRDWIVNNCRAMPKSMSSTLDLADRAERTAAYQSGRTQPHADRPARRQDGRTSA